MTQLPPSSPRLPARLLPMVALVSSLPGLTAAPVAWAQAATKQPKKNADAAAAASSPSTASSAPSTESSSGGPTAAPEAAASAKTVTTPAEGAPPNTPPPIGGDTSITYEDPNKRYVFVGLRYRGTVIPQFIENLFVNEGGTIYSNTIGAELDIRKGGQSMIPWIQYTDYNTGDILFMQKGQTDTANNYSVVNSSLKSLYLGLDELWSVPVANHLDFEFGFGVGIGFIFGNLQNNWVQEDSKGTLVNSAGRHFSPCATATSGSMTGCDPGAHTDPKPAKVGGYQEANWFNGGSVPVFFPHISIPQIGLRYKPIKSFETRLGMGLSLTGFWFGLSGDYGLEKTERADEPVHKVSREAPRREPF